MNREEFYVMSAGQDDNIVYIDIHEIVAHVSLRHVTYVTILHFYNVSTRSPTRDLINEVINKNRCEITDFDVRM